MSIPTTLNPTNFYDIPANSAITYDIWLTRIHTDTDVHSGGYQFQALPAFYTIILQKYVTLTTLLEQKYVDFVVTNPESAMTNF